MKVACKLILIIILIIIIKNVEGNTVVAQLGKSNGKTSSATMIDLDWVKHVKWGD